MIKAIREGWRYERADMVKVLLGLFAFGSLIVGAIVALWISGAPELAIACALYWIAYISGYQSGRDHERKARS